MPARTLFVIVGKYKIIVLVVTVFNKAARPLV